MINLLLRKIFASVLILFISRYIKRWAVKKA